MKMILSIIASRICVMNLNVVLSMCETDVVRKLKRTESLTDKSYSIILLERDTIRMKN